LSIHKKSLELPFESKWYSYKINVMKKLFVLLVTAFIAVGSMPVKAQLEIVSGLEGGTYFHLANDFRKVSSIPMNIYTSKGSIDNFEQLMGANKINITFLQYDVLIMQGILNSKIREKVRILLPLFIDEEIHLITKKDSKIKSVKDLKFKKVGIGLPSQGTNITARNIKDKLGIVWTDVETHSNDGLQALLEGKVDAYFYVGGAPVEALQAFGAAAKDQIKLVAISDRRLKGTYQPRIIKKGLYAWVEKDVKTIVVPTILAVNLDKLSPDMKSQVELLYRDITDNVKKLQTEGHPKWKSVYYQNAEIHWPYYYIPRK
jgi:hypothetical protein